MIGGRAGPAEPPAPRPTTRVYEDAPVVRPPRHAAESRPSIDADQGPADPITSDVGACWMLVPAPAGTTSRCDPTGGPGPPTLAAYNLCPDPLVHFTRNEWKTCTFGGLTYCVRCASFRVVAIAFAIERSPRLGRR